MAEHARRLGTHRRCTQWRCPQLPVCSVLLEKRGLTSAATTPVTVDFKPRTQVVINGFRAEAHSHFTNKLRRRVKFRMIALNDSAGSPNCHFRAGKDSRDKRSTAPRIEERARATAIRVFCSRFCTGRAGVTFEATASASDIE